MRSRAATARWIRTSRRCARNCTRSTPRANRSARIAASGIRSTPDMRIGLRVFLGYFVIVALAAILLARVFVAEVKPGVRQAMEDTLAETANLLAEIATDDFLAGHINDGRFAERVRKVRERDL